MAYSYLQIQSDDGVHQNLLTLQESLSWYILLEESTDVSDQVEIQLPKTRVFEGAAFTATAYFRTRSSKTGTAPTNAYYRVDCLTTGTVLADWTAVSALGVSSDISITTAMNAIQDDSKKRERKQITVQADRGLSTVAVGKANWVVENLIGSP